MACAPVAAAAAVHAVLDFRMHSHAIARAEGRVVVCAQGRVVSGHNVALARVAELAQEAGALKAQ